LGSQHRKPERCRRDIDTGANYNHPDLAANMWTNPGEINGNMIDDDGNGFVDDFYGWDFRFNDSDPFDQHGHGTHTSGTIGAVGNNGVGVVGVNWTVRLMTIKIYSAAATDTTSAQLIAAYQYVLMMKNRGINIRVTNNSYGGCPETCGYDQATKDAIDALGNAGILNRLRGRKLRYQQRRLAVLSGDLHIAERSRGRRLELDRRTRVQLRSCHRRSRSTGVEHSQHAAKRFLRKHEWNVDGDSTRHGRRGVALGI
jgi:hypothetical protein